MLTKHVRSRCQQRGIRKTDLDLVAQYGTETSEGVILTRKDIAGVEREFKRLINRLLKLEDVFVAMDGEIMKTVFRTTKQQRRAQVGNR